MALRFDKAFSVLVGSEIYGDCRGVARNLSGGGMYVEMADPPPIGSVVTIHFRVPDGGEDVIARAEVKHHYCFNFAVVGAPTLARGVGLRFLEFLAQDTETPGSSFTRNRTLH
jgi:hypothetical protein